MNNLIFSFIIFGDNYERKERFENTFIFEKYKDFLKQEKKVYSEQVNCDFLLVEEDHEYQKFHKDMIQKYPFFDDYDIINFYKFKLLDNFTKIYDKVVYLDFDIIRGDRFENIFNFFDFSKFTLGINTYPLPKKEIEKIYPDKGWNNHIKACFSDIIIENMYNKSPYQYHVYNTGFMCCSRHSFEKLNYFGDFERIIKYIHDIKMKYVSVLKDTLGQFIVGYDNEIVFTVRAFDNEVVTPISYDSIWCFPTKHKYDHKNKVFLHIKSIKKDLYKFHYNY